MKSLNWSVVCPAGAPTAVETARKSVEALRAKLDQARSDIETAQAAVRAAEEADQAAMAQQLREGKKPVSSTEKIEALRSAAAEAQRRSGALDLAIAQSEQELGEAIGKARQRWSRDVAERGERAREQARAKLDELAQALDTLRQLRGIEDWLAPDRGFDHGQGVRGVPVGYAVSSRSASANSDPFSSTQLVGWMREVVDPPSRPEPPTLRATPGPASRAAAPVEAA